MTDPAAPLRSFLTSIDQHNVATAKLIGEIAAHGEARDRILADGKALGLAALRVRAMVPPLSAAPLAEEAAAEQAQGAGTSPAEATPTPEGAAAPVQPPQDSDGIDIPAHLRVENQAWRNKPKPQEAA